MQLSFVKINSNEHLDEIAFLLKKNGLILKVLLLATCRIRRSDSDILKLKEGEFLLSQTETHIFGLKKTQQGKLRRAIFELIKAGIIEKVDSKTDNYNANIYRLKEGDLVSWSRETDNKVDSQQTTDRQLIDNRQTQTKSDKRDKSVESGIPDIAENENQPRPRITLKEPMRSECIGAVKRLFKDHFEHSLVESLDGKVTLLLSEILLKMKGLRNGELPTTQEFEAELDSFFAWFAVKYDWAKTNMETVKPLVARYELFCTERSPVDNTPQAPAELFDAEGYHIEQGWHISEWKIRQLTAHN